MSSYLTISAPAAHIATLTAKWEEGNKDLAELRQKYESSDNKYKEDLEAALTALRTVSKKDKNEV